jgi:phosphoglycolate phosphatase
MLNKTQIYLMNQIKPDAVMEQLRRDTLSIAETYELEAASKTSLLPGATETLKTLKHAGLKIGLCTINSEKSMTHILQRFNLTEYFDAAIPREKVNYIKPHPEHLKTVLAALHVAPEEAVVVGDSKIDMQAARDLKAIAVGLPTGVSTPEQLMANGANYLITSITDLPLLIEKLNNPQKQP